ncbi:MAG: hypothetical protein CL916_15120 [Deltaproteobacteria bacterium]|nr:hypothetical protein [Deltaproteobacteria bacterium]
MSFGIYVHHPWCVRKCAYCAFNVYTDKNPPFSIWREHISRDWKLEKKFFQEKPMTIYFGGGTPSLAPVSIISDMILEFNPMENAEITLEINPGDLSQNHLQGLQIAGVSRYSIGIQSFNPRFSKLLNRSHTVHDNHELLSLITKVRPKSWSLDLIFGLPDQNLEELIWDIDQALKHNPPHISIYGLTVERGTPLERGVQKGSIIPLDEDIWSDQFLYIMERLRKEGYEQYEISNFARSDHRSKHNEHIWKNGAYIGLGPGAHGFRIDGTRTVQKEKWEEWCSPDHIIIEKPTPEEALSDKVITSIRHIDGIPISLLEENGRKIDTTTMNGWIENDLITCTQTHIMLTQKGIFVADWMTQQLIEQINK